MANRFDRKPGERFSDWVLESELGAGGNAEVWRAVSPTGAEAAFKILRQRNPHSEPYRRLHFEVEAMQRAKALTGVLPLLDYSLPAQPSRENPAWIATPIAVPIRNALDADPDLREIVEAIKAIAETLALLSADYEIYHRDIKPENLYLLDGVWCLGDFGLATFPGKEAITATARHIGPLYYLAPELLLGRPVEPGPTDVYALSKTLWVLATGQTYPLPGHLTPDVEQFRIGSFIRAAGTRSLDVLISRATSPDPMVRPTISEVADELRAWLSPETSPLTIRWAPATLDRVGPMLRARTSALAERERRQQYVLKRLEDVTAALRPMGEAVAAATGLQPEYGAWSMFTDVAEIRRLVALEGASYQRHAAFHVTVPPLPGQARAVSLVSGLNLTIDADGVTHVVGGHAVLREAESAFVYTTQVRNAPMESAMEQRAIDAVIGDLTVELNAAVSALADSL